MTIRNYVKSIFASALHQTGGRQLLQRIQRVKLGGRRVLFVGYHRVVESFSEAVKHSIPGLLISSASLRRQLETAHRIGFRFATIDEALDVLSGKAASKRDLIVVTFDDAYEDVFHHGLPILRAMGIPAIMYVATEFVGTSQRFAHDRLFHLLRLFPSEDLKQLSWLSPRGKPYATSHSEISAALDDLISRSKNVELLEFIAKLEQRISSRSEKVPQDGAVMNWSQLKEWKRAGMGVGAHTVSHSVLPLLEKSEQIYQIETSKRELEGQLDLKIEHFAYCNGWYSENVVSHLLSAGMRSAVTTEDRLNAPLQNPFKIGRKILWENFSLGADGQFSEALMACHLDHVFSVFGLRRAVDGQHAEARSTLKVAR